MLTCGNGAEGALRLGGGRRKTAQNGGQPGMLPRRPDCSPSAVPVPSPGTLASPGAPPRTAWPRAPAAERLSPSSVATGSNPPRQPPCLSSYGELDRKRQQRAFCSAAGAPGRCGLLPRCRARRSPDRAPLAAAGCRGGDRPYQPQVRPRRGRCAKLGRLPRPQRRGQAPEAAFSAIAPGETGCR